MDYKKANDDSQMIDWAYPSQIDVVMQQSTISMVKRWKMLCYVIYQLNV
jgi:hypothetical protein